MKGVLERLLLMTFSVALLALAEGALRLAGYGSDDYGVLDFGLYASDRIYVPAAEDPETLVISHDIFGMPHRNNARFLNDDTFPRHRPKGELRIVAIGESFVYGYPEGGPTAWPYQLGEIVQRRHPEVRVKAIDAGIPAYDSRRVLKIVRETVRYEPSVVILATGNNEYFRRFETEGLRKLGLRIRLQQALYKLRLYQLLARALRPVTGRLALDSIDVTSLMRQLDKGEGWTTPRADEETRRVEARFRGSVQQAIDAAGQAHVPLVLCTVPTNLKFFPGKTAYDRDLPRETRQECERLRGEIDGLLAMHELIAAQEKCDEALRLAPRHAWFLFRRAQALEGQGRVDEAFGLYLAAKELESTPNRCSVVMNQTVRELARRANVQVVDLETELIAGGTHGPFSSALFQDHCHPTAEGNCAIAELIADAVDWDELPR